MVTSHLFPPNFNSFSPLQAKWYYITTALDSFQLKNLPGLPLCRCPRPTLLGLFLHLPSIHTKILLFPKDTGDFCLGSSHMLFLLPGILFPITSLSLPILTQCWALNQKNHFLWKTLPDYLFRLLTCTSIYNTVWLNTCMSCLMSVSREHRSLRAGTMMGFAHHWIPKCLEQCPPYGRCLVNTTG